MNHSIKVAFLTTIVIFSSFAGTDKANPANPVIDTTSAANSAKEIAPNSQPDKKSDESEYEKVIKDFNDYMLTVKPEIKKEISDFRQKMQELNEQKKQLYKKLTEEAQNYLKKEREFKKKLPIKKRQEWYNEKMQKDAVKNTTPSAGK
jgi:hypothetical protein